MSVKKSDRTSMKRKYSAPGGETRIDYHKRKHIKLRCSGCGKELHGIPTKIKGKAKTEKVPNRPYAGTFCSSCMRKKIKDKIIKGSGVL